MLITKGLTSQLEINLADGFQQDEPVFTSAYQM
jgi:hypothetical protein